MPQPSPTAPAPSSLNREAAALPSASAAPASSAPEEIVIRPDGLRHGKWEAQPWAFYSIAAVAVAFAVIYGIVRLNLIRSKRKSKPS